MDHRQPIEGDHGVLRISSRRCPGVGGGERGPTPSWLLTASFR
jgi:hypothetical protein